MKIRTLFYSTLLTVWLCACGGGGTPGYYPSDGSDVQQDAAVVETQSSSDVVDGADVPLDDNLGEPEVFDCERGATIDRGSVVPYPVEGDTCEEASISIFGSREYAGETECHLEENYVVGFRGAPFDDGKPCCEASLVNIIILNYATVSLPDWDGCDPCFGEFYRNLVEHEQGHVNHCLEAGRSLVEG